MAKLTVIAGENVGADYFLKQNNVLGRASDVDCVLKDLRASRKHSCITYEDNSYHLSDMGSHNGTYLNGQRIAGKMLLKNNDKVGIGATVLAFLVEKQQLEKKQGLDTYAIMNQVKKSDTGDFSIARQKILERDVLLWRIGREVLEGSGQKIQQEFIQQIQTVANVFHRNLLILLDFGANANFLYCAFECVDLKHNLKCYLENKVLSLPSALELAIQTATGLEHAHQQNMPHLHLTDRNILVEPEHERIILTELGISKFLSSATITSSHGTTTTGILGVSLYISPEQAQGEPNITPLADIYSFGCILYHLTTGSAPFVTNNIYDLCNCHINEIPIAPEKKRSEIPKAISNLIQKCMDKEPQNRPQWSEIIEIISREKQKLMYLQSIYSEESKQYLRQKFGEIRLKKWWFLGPMVTLFLTTLLFFIVRYFFHK